MAFRRCTSSLLDKSTSAVRYSLSNNSITKRCFSTLKLNTHRLSLSSETTVVNRTSACFMHKKTEGDADLLSFLKEEIEYEESSSSKLPTIEGFKGELKGTSATFQKSENGEKILVTFDVNDNVNIDEGDEDVHQDDDPEMQQDAKIISYPSFVVKISKGKGTTLQLTCEFDHNDLDEDEAEEAVTEEDGYDEPFRIDTVAVLNAPNADETLMYHAETDTMDPNLYNLLMNTLYERGITSDFARSMLDYSTMAEQHLYLDFLHKLKSFTDEK